MSVIANKKKSLVIILFLIGMLGCAMQPSQEMIKTAVEESLKNELDRSLGENVFGIATRDFVGISGVKVTSLRVIECERKSLKRFVCEIFIEYEVVFKDASLGALLKGLGSVSGLHQVDLFSDTNGWLVLELSKKL